MSKKNKHQERKEIPVFSGVLKYFPKAIRYVSKVSYVGNEQHNPGTPLHWDREKSKDELDACVRHLIDHTEEPVDDDGFLHLGTAEWRTLGEWEEFLKMKNE